MKNTLLIATLMIAVTSQAAENTSADAQTVNAACTADATTASCGTEKVGTGLLKCLHAYKKAHSEFKFSDGCKVAMKTLRKNRKETK